MVISSIISFKPDDLTGHLAAGLQVSWSEDHKYVAGQPLTCSTHMLLEVDAGAGPASLQPEAKNMLTWSFIHPTASGAAHRCEACWKPAFILESLRAMQFQQGWHHGNVHMRVSLQPWTFAGSSIRTSTIAVMVSHEQCRCSCSQSRRM